MADIFAAQTSATADRLRQHAPMPIRANALVWVEE
jgi:hypothetical protein